MSSIQSFYFVGVITLVSSAHVYGQKKDKMNVLFIIADDMRPELGCYGIEDIVTPHIDRLAEQATVFQNAYCNIPVSGASRASLFTGVYPCYPERFTAFDANAEKDCPKALSLPECFKKNGYYVISNGKVFHNITDHARSGQNIRGEYILMVTVRIGLNIISGNCGRTKSLPVISTLRLCEDRSVNRLMSRIQLILMVE